MSEYFSWWGLSLIGFVLSSIGGFGGVLLDRFAGRPFEAYCRFKRNRERFGAVLDHQEDALLGSAYLRMIGTATFLIAGTTAILASDATLHPWKLAAWGLIAVALMMLVHAWLPAAVTRFASKQVLYHTWPFWYVLSIVMSPLALPGVVVEFVTRRITGTLANEDEEEEQLEDEIRTIVAAGTREGYFGPGVREMIQGVMALNDDTVGHIMTPRGDVDAIDIAWDWDRVLKAIVDAGRTRFPVYEGTLDNVIGILYVKDLLPYIYNTTAPDKPLKEILRKAWIVPVDRSVETILREFLHSRSHMAIVLDEFQQTVGVVTIEDALEEIVGEIVDESDEDEEFGIELLDEVTVRVDGRVMMDDLNESTGWNLPESDDYETVAGYVLYHTGTIPESGQRLQIGDVEIEILQATNRKIESMKIHQNRLQEQDVS